MENTVGGIISLKNLVCEKLWELSDGTLFQLSLECLLYATVYIVEFTHGLNLVQRNKQYHRKVLLGSFFER